MKLTSYHFMIALAFMALCLFGYKGFIDAKRDMEKFAQQERERVSKKTVELNHATPEDILKDLK